MDWLRALIYISKQLRRRASLAMTPAPPVHNINRQCRTWVSTFSVGSEWRATHAVVQVHQFVQVDGGKKFICMDLYIYMSPKHVCTHIVEFKGKKFGWHNTLHSYSEDLILSHDLLTHAYNILVRTDQVDYYFFFSLFSAFFVHMLMMMSTSRRTISFAHFIQRAMRSMQKKHDRQTKK